MMCVLTAVHGRSPNAHRVDFRLFLFYLFIIFFFTNIGTEKESFVSMTQNARTRLFGMRKLRQNYQWTRTCSAFVCNVKVMRNCGHSYYFDL